MLAIVFYSVGASYLEGSYGASYSNLPSAFKAGGVGVLITQPLYAFIHNPVQALGSNIAMYVAGYKEYLIYAFLLAILGFGLTLLVDPLIALLFGLTWLGGVFVLGLAEFLLPLTNYFGYVIGPAVSAAILGILIARKKKTYLSKAIEGLGLDFDNTIKFAAIALPILLSIVGPAIYLLVASPDTQYHSISASNINQILLFESNSSQRAAYSQLYSALAQVPQNASVLAQYFVTAHLADRRYLDTFVVGNYSYQPQSFQPHYVLVDFNRNISSSMCLLDNCTRLNDTVDSANYSVYFSNGTAVPLQKDGLALLLEPGVDQGTEFVSYDLWQLAATHIRWSLCRPPFPVLDHKSGCGHVFHGSPSREL